MRDRTLNRRDVLRQSSALTVAGLLGAGDVASAVGSDGPAERSDEDREPDLVVLNNSTEAVRTEIALVDEDTATTRQRYGVETRGFNHAAAANQDKASRRADARHEITRLQTPSAGTYRVEAEFGDETASGRIYVGDDGAPDDETLVITLFPSGRITANTTVTCE